MCLFNLACCTITGFLPEGLIFSQFIPSTVLVIFWWLFSVGWEVLRRLFFFLNSTNSDKEIEGNWDGGMKNQAHRQSGPQAKSRWDIHKLNDTLLKSQPLQQKNHHTALCWVGHVILNIFFQKICNWNNCGGHIPKQSTLLVVFLGQDGSQNPDAQYNVLKDSWRKMIIM